MTTQYDFSDLTEAEQGLLTVGGWHTDSALPRPKFASVTKLKQRLLIRETKRELNGRFIIGYAVPSAAHIAWSEHCSKILSD